MRIDSHQHFWKYDPVRDSWIDSSMHTLRRDFMPEELAPIYRAYQLDGCVAVQADQSEAETEFLLQLAAKNDFIKGVVGWVDLCSENVEQRLRHYGEYKHFKGVRHILQAEDEDFMLRADFMQGISALAPLDLRYDVLIFPKHLKHAKRLVEAFPEQLFVVDHLAKPHVKLGELKDWKHDITTLAQNPNVYCKVSGLLTEANWTSWKPEDFTPYLDTVFHAFGAERLMYGSDWPVCLLAGNYGDALRIVERYIEAMPLDTQEAIMGENARKFYNLN